MAQTKNLGKVAVTPRGAYSSGSAYERLDIVTYAGGSWIALQDVQGVTPSAGAYWALLTSKGDKGDTGQAATVAVGTVTTLSPGAQATVTNSGTQNNAVLDFGIPQGPAGNVSSVDGVSATGGNVPLTAVQYGAAQTLSGTEQETARDNIGAAAAADLSNYIPTSQKGAASGVATLDESSLVTASQLYSPSVSVSANTDIATYYGYTMYASGTITLSIGTYTDTAEIVIWNTGTGTVTISGTLYVQGYGNRTSCKIDSYGCVLVKIRSGRAYVSGNISV